MEVSKRKIKHILITEEGGGDCRQNPPLYITQKLQRNCLLLGTMLPDLSGHTLTWFFDMFACRLGKTITFLWAHLPAKSRCVASALGLWMRKNTQKRHPSILTFTTVSEKLPLMENMSRDRNSHPPPITSLRVYNGVWEKSFSQKSREWFSWVVHLSISLKDLWLQLNI